jgi:cation diffusion facilitator family transporter
MQPAAARKTGIAIVSVVSNSTLVLLKLIVGLLIGSISVISEAIHSGVDLVASLIALFAVKGSAKPADSRHPFGHGKLENLSGTVEALLIFVAAGWIIYESVHKLILPGAMHAPGWGVGVMLFSALVNAVVSHFLFKVGRETDSVALVADAWHLRTDVYTSLGVTLALGLIWLGESILPQVDLRWLDPVAAITVALLISKAAFELTIESGRDLLDVSLPQDEESRIREVIESYKPAAWGYHHLRTRKSGSHRFVEFHLVMDPGMSVEESHQVTDNLSEDLQALFPGSSVTVHVEPCNGSCTPECRQGCLLEEEERRRRHGAASSA